MGRPTTHGRRNGRGHGPRGRVGIYTVQRYELVSNRGLVIARRTGRLHLVYAIDIDEAREHAKRYRRRSNEYLQVRRANRKWLWRYEHSWMPAPTGVGLL